MNIQNLIREFAYNGAKLADPNPAFTLVQVRDFYATVYPEITSADIEGPATVGAKVVYTFRRAVGTKGQANAHLCMLDEIAREAWSGIYQRVGVLSTGERLYVAVASGRMRELCPSDSIVYAVGRIGEEWMAHMAAEWSSMSQPKC